MDVASGVKAIQEFLKEKARYLVPVALATSFLVFAPPQWLGSYLRKFMDFAGGYVAALWALVVAVLLTQVGTVIWDKASAKRADATEGQRRVAALKKLSPVEKGFLKLFVAANSKSLGLWPMGGIGGLVSQGFVAKTAEIGNAMSWNYTVQPWVWEYLLANPHLLNDSQVPTDAYFRMS